MDFKGKVAIITGGSQGIGSAYANALLKMGMKVCIADLKEEIGKMFIDSLPDTTKSCVIFQKCDVSSYDELKTVFETTISKFGRIDMVINNAGKFGEEDWKKTIEVNFIGVLYGIKLAFQYMDKSKNGHGGYVINTASEACLDRCPLFPLYAGTKHAVVGLTKGYGADYHFNKTGVTVNAICPGPVDTGFFRAFPSLTVDPDEAKKLVEGMVPVKPDDVAYALLKLLADGKNGALLRIDANGLRYVD